jgi:hypothetical protein
MMRKILNFNNIYLKHWNLDKSSFTENKSIKDFEFYLDSTMINDSSIYQVLNI